jgi:hypothetical protein
MDPAAAASLVAGRGAPVGQGRRWAAGGVGDEREEMRKCPKKEMRKEGIYDMWIH